MNKKNLLLNMLILCLLFLISCGSSSNDNDNLKIINEVKAKYVPDRRDNVFDIELVETNGTLILKGYTSVEEAKNELTTRIDAIDSIILLPDSALGEEIYGIINVSVADIKTENDYSAEPATQVLLGMSVSLLQYDKWWRIRTPEGYLGWTTGSSFVRMNADDYKKWNVSEKVIFTAICGFAYEKPDVKSQTVSDLVFGNLLKIMEKEGNFIKVEYPDGREAYVLSTECESFDKWSFETVLTEEKIVEKALLLKGIPYSWGGTSTKMMDCSGFTKTVFLMNGIVLLRDASQQAKTGVEVDISAGYDNLKKGDLMFFGKNGRIRHVAIYLGNGDFIHAAGYIRISSLDPTKPNYDEHNTKEFVKASRIIDAVGTRGITQLSNLIKNQ